MARISEMHKKWLEEPKYKKAYDALEEEFVLAGAVMDVRNRAGLTQEELARRVGATQPVVARLDTGRSRPSARARPAALSLDGPSYSVCAAGEGWKLIWDFLGRHRAT